MLEFHWKWRSNRFNVNIDKFKENDSLEKNIISLLFLNSNLEHCEMNEEGIESLLLVFPFYRVSTIEYVRKGNKDP